jgi:Ca-activated chloride channel family protein
MILFRSPGGARAGEITSVAGNTSGAFAGRGLHGRVGLSQSKVEARDDARVFAEMRLAASEDDQKQRAPLAFAIVLDTSGSMEGEKIAQAKNAVIRLVREMHDDDEVAIVRYSDDSELVQSLTRVGPMRESIEQRIRNLTAAGGTAIPRGLSEGMRALEGSSRGRVRHVVLVSDGLDSTRVEAERLASQSFERGVTISSMGIGLDFDESYMGSVARAGHGNFGFVKDASTLASILRKELEETATTTVEGARVVMHLPAGVRFVRATGAEAKSGKSGEIELAVGSLAAGEERRVVAELACDFANGEARGIDTVVHWDVVGGGAEEASPGRLDLVGTSDARTASASRDGEIFASATSSLAAADQLEATAAYAHGDATRAQNLLDQSMRQITAAASAAPPAMRAALAKQGASYGARKAEFAAAAPSSNEGKVAAKAAVADDMKMDRLK